MYKVILINNEIETIIHFPSANTETPHLNSIKVKEGLSSTDNLSFSLYPNNLGYNQVFELTTKIKVVDIRDDSVRFVGRVLDISKNMDSTGEFYKNISCENALGFLTDSKQRANVFNNPTVIEFVNEILAIHNAKVDASKQIQAGNVDINGQVFYSCNFESTLDTILIMKNKLGGEIRIREVSGILYLDWLQSFSDNTVNISLGENMKDLIVDKNVNFLGTRIIPLGANNLTISSINGGLDYIEDTVASEIYGIIEKTVEYKDVVDATELFNACMADLSTHTQPLYLLESNALDLSYLTGIKENQFALGTNLHIINSVMGIDAAYKVMQIELDLLQAYNPKLIIANFKIQQSTAFNDLRKTSIQKESVSNGVQIGENFGIRIVRSDNKVITTLNAIEGISIENDTKKVFYVDENGFLKAVDIVAEGGTFNNINAVNVTATNGTYTDIKVKNMKTDNEEDYMQFHDEFIDFYLQDNKMLSLGCVDLGDLFGKIPGATGTMFMFKFGESYMILNNDGMQINGESLFVGGVEITGDLTVNGKPLATSESISESGFATQEWVADEINGQVAQIIDLLNSYATKNWVTANFAPKTT